MESRAKNFSSPRYSIIPHQPCIYPRTTTHPAFALSLVFLPVIFSHLLIPIHTMPSIPQFLVTYRWPIKAGPCHETESAGKTKRFGRNRISVEIPPLERTVRSSKSFAQKMLRHSKFFLRMDETSFDELLEIFKPQLQKQDTNMRKSIPTGGKLALTLRYLATGEFICSALFTSIMAKRASLGDRISPKTSCCSQYRELFFFIY